MKRSLKPYEDLGGQSKPMSSTSEDSEPKRGALKRTPLSKLKTVNCNFKSPGQLTKTAKVSVEEEVEELERSRKQLDAEIAQLESEGYKVEELDDHIDMLHEYNDIKDMGQSLLGKMAAVRRTTTRDLYRHFGLELDD
ncbi:DNA repair protein SWI5 homolog [Nerophis ophidion]|uniref:DNA repair protein SWI5 homolog n=1 Tax=Nerophis ophidion TaxID=159077 RepID=UPI002ADFF3CB|nr:DNA repair protein SWI5 homolog [Nerophis ophidion]